jgi:hypothetical protein
MVGEDIYRRPPIFFGDRLRESQSLSVQERITKSLLAATDSNNVTEFLVKLIYGENFNLPARLLDTKIEASGPRVLELADAIEQIESYRNFRGPDLACQLQYLHYKGCIMEARFGRENSPVLYVKAPYWTHQASNGRDYVQRRYSESEYDAIKTEILKSLKRLRPDELDEAEAYGIRAWWG